MKFFLKIIVVVFALSVFSVLYFSNSRTFQNEKFVIASTYFLGSSGKSVELSKAINIWTNLAETDHVPSQCFLAFVYSKGYQYVSDKPLQEISPNAVKARKWTNSAADNGCVLAQNLMYYNDASYDAHKTKPQHVLMEKDFTNISPLIALSIIGNTEIEDKQPSFFHSLAFFLLTIFYL